MKEGFQIEIQKDLSDPDMKLAQNFANEFISKTCRDHMVFSYGGRTGGYASYIRRGKFGYLLLKPTKEGYFENTDLVFRRLSKNQRIFGIVKYTKLIDKATGKTPNINQCMCPKHRGGLKVRWADKKPETFVYARVGEIKG